MEILVGSIIKALQIANRVVPAISILMVDYFVLAEIPPQVSLHD